MPSKKKKLSVYLSDDEYQEIRQSADKAGISFSRFAKMMCMGQTIKSIEAQRVIIELVKVRADMGRLGGLLKLWLTDKDNHATDVRMLLRELEAGQRAINRQIKELENGK